jgi:hypothetical protein
MGQAVLSVVAFIAHTPREKGTCMQSLLSRFARSLLLVCGCAAVLASSARPVVAQEVLSGEVDLGASMFTIEDLENLSAAANLSKDQRDAALELMRGGMARARSLALKSARKLMDDVEGHEMDEEKMMKRMEEWRDAEKKKAEELVTIEKEVMGELKMLLEGEQANEGWNKFERSRRRLLLQGVSETIMAAGHGDDDSMMSYDIMGMGQGVPDLVGTVRASKLEAADTKAIAEPIEQYETNMDTLVKEYRSLAAPLLKGGGNTWMMYGMDEENKPGVDAKKLKDIATRMKQTHVRHAKLVAEALTGDARERFIRQRLRAEFQWRWQPSKRVPQVQSILKLRSLSESQREEINALVKKTDSKLIELAAKGLAEQDEGILQDKQEEASNPWEEMQKPEAMERAKEEAKLRSQLVKDAVAVLNSEQRNAYETGIENDDDMKNMFEKRRHGRHRWEQMSELYGTDAVSPWGSSDEEEMP